MKARGPSRKGEVALSRICTSSSLANRSKAPRVLLRLFWIYATEVKIRRRAGWREPASEYLASHSLCGTCDDCRHKLRRIHVGIRQRINERNARCDDNLHAVRNQRVWPGNRYHHDSRAINDSREDTPPWRLRKKAQRRKVNAATQPTNATCLTLPAPRLRSLLFPSWKPIFLG